MCRAVYRCGSCENMPNYGVVLPLGTVLLFVLVGANVSSRIKKCEVMVNIDSGPVCGSELVAEKGMRYYSFRGIPYAKPPFGHRRFKTPEPPQPWSEPLYATTEGPACPQRDSIYGHMPVQINGQSEDCLYINIHIPATAKLNQQQAACVKCTSSLPILVYIPGGGFYCGSGDTDTLGPEYLMRKNIIVLTFNYRLNVMGFMCFNDENIPCNRGLWDMVAVLKWVKRNARAFGGNPDKVTLMGQSAGATAAHLLSLSKHTQGLFKRIILMSGTGNPSYYTASPAYAKYIANIFLQKLGLNSTDPVYTHQQLIEMPLHKIMEANDYVQYKIGIISFVPVVENNHVGGPRFLDEEPITLIGKGRGKNLPMLISFTNNEIAFFRWLLMIIDITKRLKESPEMILSPRLIYSLPETEVNRAVEKVLQKFFNGDSINDEQLMPYLTDSYFKYPALKLAEWRAALGGAPVYLNQFSYESVFSTLKHGLWNDHEGACHMEDLTYVFRTNAVLNKYLHLPPRKRDNQMVEWMTDIITNFMRCSNPTCVEDEVSPWPPVRRDNMTYQEIAEPKVYRTMSLTREQQDMIQFFDSIDPESRHLSELLYNSRR